MSALPSQRWAEPTDDPLRDFEPTDEQIADRAAYLLPLIRANYPNPSDLVHQEMGSPLWMSRLDAALRGNDHGVTHALLLEMLAAGELAEAEDLACHELHRIDNYSNDRRLRSIGAGVVFEWLREKSL